MVTHGKTSSELHRVGNVSIQLRHNASALYFDVGYPRSNRGCHKGWFYFPNEALEWWTSLPYYGEMDEVKLLLADIVGLEIGLTSPIVFRTFISRWILPQKQRDYSMCKYTGHDNTNPRQRSPSTSPSSTNV